MNCEAFHSYRPSLCLKVSGEDAFSFLQSQFTNDLRLTDTGQIPYGLFLDIKGKIVADAWAVRLEKERYLLVSYFADGDRLHAQFERHIIADEVELIDCRGAYAGLSLGPQALRKLLQGLESTSPSAEPTQGAWVTSNGMICFPGRRSENEGFELLYPVSTCGEVVDALIAKLTVEGAISACDPEVLELQRIESGIVAIPDDAGAGELPAEVGLEADAVSFTKGCFLGQEVVARMHHLGKPQRNLYRVYGERLPDLPALLVQAKEGGKPVGEVRRVVWDKAKRKWCGLAILRSRRLEGGIGLSCEGRDVSFERISP